MFFEFNSGVVKPNNNKSQLTELEIKLIPSYQSINESAYISQNFIGVDILVHRGVFSKVYFAYSLPGKKCIYSNIKEKLVLNFSRTH